MKQKGSPKRDGERKLTAQIIADLQRKFDRLVSQVDSRTCTVTEGTAQAFRQLELEAQAAYRITKLDELLVLWRDVSRFRDIAYSFATLRSVPLDDGKISIRPDYETITYVGERRATGHFGE